MNSETSDSDNIDEHEVLNQQQQAHIQHNASQQTIHINQLYKIGNSKSFIKPNQISYVKDKNERLVRKPKQQASFKQCFKQQSAKQQVEQDVLIMSLPVIQCHEQILKMQIELMGVSDDIKELQLHIYEIKKQIENQFQSLKDQKLQAINIDKEKLEFEEAFKKFGYPAFGERLPVDEDVQKPSIPDSYTNEHTSDLK